MIEEEARKWLKDNLTGPLNGHKASEVADKLAARLAYMVTSEVADALTRATGRTIVPTMRKPN